MRKLTSLLAVIFLLTALNTLNCYGQRYPKVDDELLNYANQTLKPKINDTLITRLFAEAELVFEGEIINGRALWDKQQNEYTLEPYKVFKGKVPKDNTITIIANWKLENATANLGGEWSHEKDEVGIFFVKKDPQNSELYRFVNPKNAWVSYPDHISVFRHEKLLSNLLYSKIIIQKGAFCKESRFFLKKKKISM